MAPAQLKSNQQTFDYRLREVTYTCQISCRTFNISRLPTLRIVYCIAYKLICVLCWWHGSHAPWLWFKCKLKIDLPPPSVLLYSPFLITDLQMTAGQCLICLNFHIFCNKFNKTQRTPTGSALCQDNTNS